MKDYFCLIILVIVIVSDDCVAQYIEDTYIGNPDSNADVVRPCSVYDLNCIRRFFAKNSKCYITRGPIPGSIFRSQVNYELPRVNISLILISEIIMGLDSGRIEEFYVNRNTNRLVISIEFRGLGLFSNNSYFSFNRRAKEPTVTLDFTTARYNSVVMTGVFPKADNLQLGKAEITVYSNDALPPFAFGPGVARGTDATAQAEIVEILADAPTNIQELFLADASFYLSSYIQYNICNFGLKIN